MGALGSVTAGLAPADDASQDGQCRPQPVRGAIQGVDGRQRGVGRRRLVKVVAEVPTCRKAVGGYAHQLSLGERRSSKKRTSCERGKTTGSNDRLPPRAYGGAQGPRRTRDPMRLRAAGRNRLLAGRGPPTRSREAEVRGGALRYPSRRCGLLLGKIGEVMPNAPRSARFPLRSVLQHSAPLSGPTAAESRTFSRQSAGPWAKAARSRCAAAEWKT